MTWLKLFPFVYFKKTLPGVTEDIIQCVLQAVIVPIMTGQLIFMCKIGGVML